MQRDKQVYSLAQLKKEHDKDIQSGQPEKLHSTIGLIVDASNVYRYETSRDFTQKLKIVDSTNSADPLQVYLWSNRKEDFTLNLKVGDVILLNNFKIESYNDRLQVKKAYKTEDSYFRIFSGSPDTSNYHPIDKKVGLDDEDGKVLTALNQLRTFAKTHFAKNRVPVMFKPDAKAKVDPKKPTSSDFDVILRVIDAVEMSNHYKIRLTNEKDEFHLNYTRHIEPGVYKVRSVADVKWEDRICNLSGNDYTFFLEISSWMLSHNPKEWERIVSTPETIKKRSKRAKIETKIVGPSKKIKSKSLKDLFSQGTLPLTQMSTKMR